MGAYQRLKGRWQEHKVNQARREADQREYQDQFAEEKQKALSEERKRALVSQARREARHEAQQEVQQRHRSSGGGIMGAGKSALNFMAGSPLGTGEFLGGTPSKRGRGAADIMNDMGSAMGFMDAPKAPRKKKKGKKRR